MTPWLSIIVPTQGQRREGLLRTIESVRHQAPATRVGVELLIVADTHGFVDEIAMEDLRAEIAACGLRHRWLEYDAGLHCYGQPQRTFGAQQALGEWVGFSQDDNILAAGALDAIWMGVCTSPHKRPLFFRVLTSWRAEIWAERSLYQGNIDADCLVLPRELAREITWGLRYEGDYDAALSAMQRVQGDVGWCEDLVGIARPETGDLWW